MGTIDYIKEKIKQLYLNNPNIHITTKAMQQKMLVENIPVKIVGIYRNIFQIEENNTTIRPERYSFQYGDILIGHIKIQELDFTPPEPPKQK